MRAAIGLMFLFTLGAFTMQATCADEPKKDEPKKKYPDLTKEESFNEKVTVKRFANGKLADPEKNVRATRLEGYYKKGETVFVLMANDFNGVPLKGTSITDKDGVIWELTKQGSHHKYNFSYYKCEVQKKSEPKKP